MDAGANIVIEQYLPGEEVSYFALVDGETVIPLGSAQASWVDIAHAYLKQMNEFLSKCVGHLRPSTVTADSICWFAL